MPFPSDNLVRPFHCRLVTGKFEIGDESFGTESHILDNWAMQIRAGDRPVYDVNELLRHEPTVDAMSQVKSFNVYRTLIAFFLPGLLFLAALLGILFVLRLIR